MRGIAGSLAIAAEGELCLLLDLVVHLLELERGAPRATSPRVSAALGQGEHTWQRGCARGRPPPSNVDARHRTPREMPGKTAAARRAP